MRRSLGLESVERCDRREKKSILKKFDGVGVQLNSYTLLDEIHREYDPQTFSVANQRTLQPLQGSSLDPDLPPDCETTIRLKFLQVQTRPQSLDLESR
jgi:hypothetical protein